MKYKVQSQNGAMFSFWQTEQKANEEAQLVANRNETKVNVWHFCGSFKPEQMVTREIDEVLASLGGSPSSLSHGCLFAILSQLKKDGVSTLDFPAR